MSESVTAANHDLLRKYYILPPSMSGIVGIVFYNSLSILIGFKIFLSCILNKLIVIVVDLYACCHGQTSFPIPKWISNILRKGFVERFWLLMFHLKLFKKHWNMRRSCCLYLQNFVDLHNEGKNYCTMLSILL